MILYRMFSIISVCLLLLYSCDTFYGPSIINGYNQDIEVSFLSTKGKYYTYHWPPCRSTFVGGKIAGIFTIGEETITVDKIIVKLGGKVIRIIDKDIVDNLIIQTKNKYGDSLLGDWVIDESGIYLTDSYECTKS